MDCRWIDSSGIGVYIQGCLPFFLDSDHYFYLIGDSDKLQLFTAGHENVKILDCRLEPFSFRELLFFPSVHLSVINKCDLYYSPFFNIPGGIKIPIYTTIHDIVFPDMPELTSSIGLFLRMRFYRRTFKKSKKIFTVSQFSKSRIEHYSGGKIPIIVTHSAIQPWFLRQMKSKSKKDKTIIFIGNIKKNKGLDYLLEAFRLARLEGLSHRLVIIGNRDNFRSSDNSFLKKIDSLGPDAVLFTGFISNEKLAEYLSAAELLVQPSLYEGFGLPPLEAMILGTRAMISDIPVFKEIYADFPVLYFHSGDVIDLKEKLLNFLINQTSQPLSLPEKLKETYTFQKTASTILSALD